MPRVRTGLLVSVLAFAAAVLWPATIAVAGGGCHGEAPTQGEGDTVEMVKACFAPSVLHVDPGTEVTFVNRDPGTHNVSATGWGTQDMERGDSFTATFAEEGTFPYACMYHYGMTGAIVVGDGTGPASGTPVEVGSVTDILPASQERSAVSADSPRDSSILGWTIAGAMGLLLGAGIGATVLRRRRED